MKKGLTEIVFIMDKSGSMSGLEADTIGGYNSFLAKQKEAEGEAYISTVLFDTTNEVIHDRVPVDKVESMTVEQYQVGGCTALLDALGGAIHHIGNVHKYARDEDRPEKTIFIITTDGMENSSRMYTFDRVKKMVEFQTNRFGWEFLFLGANMDAISTAGRMGIRPEHAVQYECDSEGTELNYRVLSETVYMARCADISMQDAISADWKAEIERDYERRKRS